MSASPQQRLDELLAERVRQRTGRRVSDLRVEVRENEVILLGTTRTFHVKQLALQGAREAAPGIPVRNSIAVVRGVRPALRGYT